MRFIIRSIVRLCSLVLLLALLFIVQAGLAQEAATPAEEVKPEADAQAAQAAPANEVEPAPAAIPAAPASPSQPQIPNNQFRRPGLRPGLQNSARVMNNPAAAGPVAPGVAVQAGGKNTVGVIDFQGAPLQAVLEYYAQNLAHRSIIQAPTINGTIYFRSQSDLTVEEAKEALDTVLAINGIAVIPLGDKFMKVVQIATASTEAVPFTGPAKEQPASDALMTQVILLQYAEPADIVAALQPYMHAFGKLLPLPKSNCVLITETAANVNQMLDIIKYIDVPSSLRMETRIYVLAHAKSADVAQRLQSIIQETQNITGHTGGGAAPAPMAVPSPFRPQSPARAGTTTEEDSIIEGKVIITADERTNKIIILSRASNYPFFETLIKELDAKVEPDVTMKVILLDYAPAEDTASLINSLITGGSPSFTKKSSSSSSSGTSSSRPNVTSAPPSPIASGGGGTGSGDTGFLQFAQGVRILPDPRTNGLLVMATKEDMERIEMLIHSVDTPVAQVLIEVVIAEVTLNNELDVGVDVFKRLYAAGQVSQTGGSSTDGNVPTQLPSPGNSTSSLFTNLPTAAALAAGTGGLTYFTTFRNLGLDAVIHALSTTSRGKVLSTPVVQTMDNQEADILVGESVPVPTATQANVINNVGTLSASTALNSSIEYKDVAIELKVTPRVNPGGYVRMDIEQKVNDLGANVNISGTEVPTITKREAKSSVAVENRSTIVLGGMIQEQKTTTQTKVPFFGDIPWIGQLFKSQTNNKIRNELIIFIRPTVMRTDSAAVAEAWRRSRMLEAAKELQLEKQFEHGDLHGPASVVPSNPLPLPDHPPLPPSQGKTTPAAASSDATEQNDVYSAKMKALQEQLNQSGAPGN